MSSEPFKQENIIGLFLKKAGVESLKKLRKVDEKWLYLDNQELERRLKKGQLKSVEFSKDHFQEHLNLFLKETESNPELFRSFQLGFQDSFKFIHASFFNLYQPQLLQIVFPKEFIFTQEMAQYLGDLLGWISEDIQELQVQLKPKLNLNDVLPAVFQGPLVFPNLTKFICREDSEFTDTPVIQHFHCILDRSREADPAPNLTFLEIKPRVVDNLILEHLFGSDPTTPIALSRWSKLTHLSLDTNCNLQSVSSMLLSLASAGMALESLVLYCRPQKPGLDFAAICSDLSRFFGAQAKSLKILKLEFDLGKEYNVFETFGVRIWWPIFENVQTLMLKYPFFDMGPIPVHFPNLLYLEIGTFLDFKAIYPDEIQPSSIPTLSIEYVLLSDADERISWMESKFQSVVHFKCQSEIVRIGQKELPWSDTLEVLEIEDVYGPVKVGHLKVKVALKKLVIYPFFNLENLMTFWFEETLALNLSSITFKSLYFEKRPSYELKESISRYFPFEVIFEVEPEFK